MHLFIGEQSAYSFFNTISYYMTFVVSVLLFSVKRKSPSKITSMLKCGLSSRFNDKVGKIAEIVLVSCEALLLAYVADYTVFANRPFGELVGTGANYFAMLFLAPIFVFIVSLLLMANPLKQVDFISLVLPFRLIFVRIACYCNGCCYGVPWEYGPYNHNWLHPGNQVPVQAIEAFCSLVIFIFLLWYIKKAKTGTLYPMYVILYSFTRFLIEFFVAGYPDVLGPFNMNQIICIIAFVIGLVSFFVIGKFGNKISEFCEKPQMRVMSKLTPKK